MFKLSCVVNKKLKQNVDLAPIPLPMLRKMPKGCHCLHVCGITSLFPLSSPHGGYLEFLSVVSRMSRSLVDIEISTF